MVESIQIARITAGSIVLYNKQIEARERSARQVENEVNLKSVEYNGYMSPKTSQKVRKMLDAWLTAVEVKRKDIGATAYWRNSKITFVTLTLSAKQFHSDNYIKRNLLNRFLIEAKRDWSIQTYFWRAEPQRNGNIHFHILMDRYIDRTALRDKWNDIQSDHGYIGKFFLKWLHIDPNSTDVKGIEKIRSMSAYVVKYCCKKKTGRKIEGRIWGSSDNLRNITAFEAELDNEVFNYVQRVEKEERVQVKKTDDYTVIFCNNEAKLKKLAPALYRKWKSYYIGIFSMLYEGGAVVLQREMVKREKIRSTSRARESAARGSGRCGALGGVQMALFAPQLSSALRY